MRFIRVELKSDFLMPLKIFFYFIETLQLKLLIKGKK